MECPVAVVWDEQYLAYDFGDHPMHPVRLDLTIRLARDLGVLDRVTVLQPVAATREQLRTAHTGGYLDALQQASTDPGYEGHGLGTSDDPVFAGMYDVGALIAGGSRLAAQQVWSGSSLHAVNIAGGLHHAMPDAASGFCVVNDVVIAIRSLLAAGAERVAYVDIDVHHGDGVQDAFYDDPRVLTISLHQHPATLFPGTGLPTEVGEGDAGGTALNVALPPGTADDGWLRAFGAVVPGAVKAFAPDILVTQCGCDTHHEDPLADLALTVDGQAAAYRLLHDLAHEVAGGKWLAVGGGGYGVVRCVPRSWTSLIAQATGAPLAPSTPIPQSWRSRVVAAGMTMPLPETIGEGRAPAPQPWEPGGESWLDRAIAATRDAAYPLLGLDPDDPRD
ncbi:MAG: acetoin utilization protein AcuC [Jatrophihabitans sp.]